VAPALVIADTDIIAAAPVHLTCSGFGDMIGKYIALADWKIASILTGEYLCPEIYSLTHKAVNAVRESVAGIKGRDSKAYEKLMYGLLMSGIGMQMLGSSRCASGAEHHISHFIEMKPSGLGVHSGALHGEKVGVATLLVSREYHRLAKNGLSGFGDYTPAEYGYIADMFGKELTASVSAENSRDCAVGISRERLMDNAGELCGIISGIPDYGELVEIYSELGAKCSLADISLPEEKLGILLEYSPLVRNRLTLMRLRRSMLK
jgi:glycerol-1-phosphate dehydrogenase [NAD(P)+]